MRHVFARDEHDRFCDLHGDCAEIDTDLPAPHVWKEGYEEANCLQCFNVCACSWISRIRADERDTALQPVRDLHRPCPCRQETGLEGDCGRCDHCDEQYPCTTAKAAG